MATIPSHELSAPSFAGILSLKEMDSTTVYIFCRESILQLYLILPAELKKTMHESIAAARVRSLRLHLFGLIYPWRRGGSTRGTRCPKHASKPNEKNSGFWDPMMGRFRRRMFTGADRHLRARSIVGNVACDGVLTKLQNRQRPTSTASRMKAPRLYFLLNIQILFF